MIKLKTYGSSSKGNCHLLEINGTTLLLDCGKYTDELKEDIKNFSIHLKINWLS